MKIEVGSSQICKKPVSSKIITKSVKECLQPDGFSRFQMLQTEIRDDLILKGSKNKRVGKSRDQRSNLPQSVDPIFTSFGFAPRYPLSVADIIHGEYLNYLKDGPNVKRQVDFGVQVDRRYKTPFSKYSWFGKSSNADNNGSRARKLLQWSRVPTSPQNMSNKSESRQCEFPAGTRKFIDEPDVYTVLREIPENSKVQEMRNCLSHINKIRLQTKKSDSELSFDDLLTHLYCIDEKHAGVVTLDKFYQVIWKMKLKPDKGLFELLLREFDLITGDSVYYEEALNLLNWKYEFPDISKINDIPKELQEYTTEYQDSMRPRNI